MNNNENNDLTNIQPQENNVGGTVPPIDQSLEQPVNSVPEVNQNMAAPQMEQPINPVPEVNQNMAAPQMEQPVNPVPEVNPNMAALQMEQPINPVPEVNPNMAAPQMEQPINPVPEVNQNMAAPQMEQPINPVPPMNQNMGAVPPINGNINNQKPGFMSQYGKYIFIALIIIVLAAVAYLVFGGKKLTCTMSESIGMQLDATATFKFNGNKAKSVALTMTIKVPEEYQSQIDTIVESFKEQYKEVEEAGAKVDVKSTSSTITVTVSAPNAAFNLLDFSDNNDVTYEELKKSMQKRGFTCK